MSHAPQCDCRHGPTEPCNRELSDSVNRANDRLRQRRAWVCPACACYVSADSADRCPSCGRARAASRPYGDENDARLWCAHCGADQLHGFRCRRGKRRVWRCLECLAERDNE